MVTDFRLGSCNLSLARCEVSFAGSQVRVDFASTDLSSSQQGLLPWDSSSSRLQFCIDRLLLRYQPEPFLQRWTLPQPSGESVWVRGPRLGKFYGTLELRHQGRGGVLSLQGELADSYLDYDCSDKLAISLQAPCDMLRVDWQQHWFRSLNEAKLAGSEVVRLLQLQGQECGQFLSMVNQFPHLRDLRLGDIFQSIDLPPLAHELYRLVDLRGLYIFGAKELCLPDGISQLSALESLWLDGCDNLRLPADLFGLSGLTSLSLHGNSLRQLPSVGPVLPPLEYLELSDNLLRELPQELVENCPLSQVRLMRNPWESLPSQLASLKRVDIEVEKFRLFKDVSYVSRNPDPFRPELYYLDEERCRQLSQAIDEWPSLQPHKQAILKQARHAVYLTSKAGPGECGASRLGGWPDLPSGLAYPRDNFGRLYTFYAQLNLDDLRDTQRFLPRRGWLYFFAREEEEFSHPLVLHFEGECSQLRSFVPAQEDRFADCDRDAAYPPCQLEAMADWSLPVLYNCTHYGKARFGDDLPHFEELDKQSYQSNPDPYERLSAGSHSEQGTHSINAYVFTQHENPQEQACREFLGEAHEWCNLLTLGSDDNTGFCFWDAGTITFSVHARDLAIADFSRVFLSLESS